MLKNKHLWNTKSISMGNDLRIADTKVCQNLPIGCIRDIPSRRRMSPSAAMSEITRPPPTPAYHPHPREYALVLSMLHAGLGLIMSNRQSKFCYKIPKEMTTKARESLLISAKRKLWADITGTIKALLKTR